MSPKDLMLLLNSLEKDPQCLNCRHLKKIYALLIACGHYPICPWCKKPIYKIDDFTWDHIVPKSAGGTDTIDNLQPMHKICNNESKNDLSYQGEYTYDIKNNLEETILSVRISVVKGIAEDIKRRKAKYHNKKTRRR